MTATQTTEQALADVFAAMADAWNHADADAYGDLFTDDADFVEIRGGHHVGRRAIEHGHRDLWRTIYSGSTVEYHVEAVRDLGAGRAVGIVGATMTAPSGPLAGTNHARITAVVVEDERPWRIASFHNTLVQ